MELRRRSFLLLGLTTITAAMVGLSAAPAVAQTRDYAQTQDYAQALAINAGNFVVGEAETGRGTIHAVRWDPTRRITDLGTLPGGSFSMAEGINTWGVVAGQSSTGPDETEAVYWSRTGQITALPGLVTGPGAFSSATAINDAGTMVGYSINENGKHAVRWARGQITDLGGLPGDYDSVAFAVNDFGVAVGYSQGSSGEYAVRWDPDGRITELAVPAGASLTSSYGIDNAGYIVGSAFDQTNLQSYAVEWHPDGSVHELAGGQQDIQATAINDVRVAVGNNERSDGGLDGTIWYPDGRSSVIAPPGGGPYVFYPTGINDRGFVTGNAVDSGGPALVSPDGRIVYLGTLLNPAN